jgi:non-ribosomal peptide synthetase component E (peptide arylation enzyme)
VPAEGPVGGPGGPAEDVVDDEKLLADLRGAVGVELADYKAPDRLVVVESLPLTSMMKVDKKSLARRAAALPPTVPVR